LHRFSASRWGWAALAATALSIVGFGIQSALDYVPEPSVIEWVVFYVLFVAAAVVGFVLGITAVETGWRRGDQTVLLGLIAIVWLVLAQIIQSAWD